MSSDPLSITFAALADPTRRALLARLASGAASVTELAAPFAMSMPAISQHLKVLEQAGLIERWKFKGWTAGGLELHSEFTGPRKELDDWHRTPGNRR
jgi:DNA-binding transcriptional ArsR family regulator